MFLILLQQDIGHQEAADHQKAIDRNVSVKYPLKIERRLANQLRPSFHTKMILGGDDGMSKDYPENAYRPIAIKKCPAFVFTNEQSPEVSFKRPGLGNGLEEIVQEKNL